MSKNFTLLRSTTLVWFLVLSCICLTGPIQSALAQSVEINTSVNTPTGDESQSVAEFRKLLANPEVQSWLINAPIDSEVEIVQQATPLLREQFGDLLKQIRNRLENLSAAASSATSAPTIIAGSWTTELESTDTLRVAIYIVIFLFVGAGFEWLYTQYTHYRLLELQLRSPDNLRQRMSTSLFRALITLGSLLAFALGSIGTFLGFKWPEVIEDVVLNILIVVFVVRVATTVSRFFLSPAFEALRLVPFSSRQAKAIHRWVAVLTTMGVINFAVSDIFDQIVSMSVDQVPKSAALSVDIFLNFLWLLVILVSIWSIRKLFSDEARPGQSETSTIWHFYLKALVIAVFMLWIIDVPKLMWSAIILGSLPPVIVVFRNWVDNLFDQAEKVDVLHGQHVVSHNILVDEAEQELEAGAAEITDEADDLQAHVVKKYEIYRPIARRAARFVLILLAVVALTFAWDINLFALSSSQSFSGKAFETIVDVVIAILIADLIWVWARSAIDRRLADYEPPLDGQAPGPEARMATLLPLLRTILLITLVTMVLLSVLAAMGVNIAPLLAGAGVLGVAIGFGAQALVRDVVSGIFFLVDDAFRVGEYIEIEGLRGTVETMSIRSLRIRHHRGAVHTIPFGELKALTNYSRDWVIMKLEFRVPFDTDLKLVKK